MSAVGPTSTLRTVIFLMFMPRMDDSTSLACWGELVSLTLLVLFWSLIRIWVLMTICRVLAVKKRLVVLWASLVVWVIFYSGMGRFWVTNRDFASVFWIFICGRLCWASIMGIAMVLC